MTTDGCRLFNSSSSVLLLLLLLSIPARFLASRSDVKENFVGFDRTLHEENRSYLMFVWLQVISPYHVRQDILQFRKGQLLTHTMSRPHGKGKK